MTIVTNVEISDGKSSRRFTINDVWAREGTPLEISARELNKDGEGIVLGFRQSMLTLQDSDGNGGEILTSGGLGGESIILQWKDGKKERQAVIRGSELLIAWIQTFDPQTAEAMKKATAINTINKETDK